MSRNSSSPIRSRFVAPAFFFAMAVGLAGCSGASAEPEADVDEGALRDGALVPGAATIRFERSGQTTVLGAKRKVQRALTAFKPATGNEVTPRCSFGPATKLSFYDEGGEEIATGSYFCFRGTIKLKGARRESKFYYRSGDLDVLEEPLAVGDVLWGITKVEVARPTAAAGAQKVELRAADEIRKVRDAFDPEQEVKPHEGPNVRCAPTHVVTFFQGHDEVAQATYICGADGPIKAKLSVPNLEREREWMLKGAVEVDAPKIDALLEAASR